MVVWLSAHGRVRGRGLGAQIGGFMDWDGLVRGGGSGARCPMLWRRRSRVRMRVQDLCGWSCSRGLVSSHLSQPVHTRTSSTTLPSAEPRTGACSLRSARELHTATLSTAQRSTVHPNLLRCPPEDRPSPSDCSRRRSSIESCARAFTPESGRVDGREPGKGSHGRRCTRGRAR